VALRPLGSDARQEVLALDALVERLRDAARPPDLRG
jgi:threonyl-tRNA synthetase